MRRRRIEFLVFLAAASPLGAQSLLADLEPGPQSSTVGAFTPFRDLVFFSAHTFARGNEVWCTDGTAGGTHDIDLLPGAGSGHQDPRLFALDRAIVFFGTDGVRSGLFATEGTLASTHFLSPLRVAGQPTTIRSDVVVLDGSGYFTATLQTGQGVLMRTDGTAAGTAAVRSFAAVSTAEIVAVGARVVFAAGTGANELWASDGTTTGTTRIASFGTTWVSKLSVVGNRVCFVEGGSTTATPLWVTDGTTTGTTQVAGFPSRYVLSIADRAGVAIVLASPVGGDVELWRTDATAPGTLFLARLVQGAGGPLPAAGAGYAIAADDLVYVVLGSQSATLWRTDGTVAGTVQFWPIGYRLRLYRPAAAIGNRLLFGSIYGTDGDEPWVTDGTTAGTHRLADIAPGPASSMPASFTLAANLAGGPAILFTAYDATFGTEPWILPVADTGAAAIAAVRPGCASAGPRPRLEPVGCAPRAGDSGFTLRISGGHPSAPVALLLDPNIGGSWYGCAILAPAAVVVPALADTAGLAQYPLPVPAIPSLLGRRLYAQPAVFVPGGAVLGLADAGAISALVIGS